MRGMAVGFLVVGVLAALARGVAWGAEDAPLVIGPEIQKLAVVRTRGELEKQPALRIGRAGTVRLGLEAAEGAQGMGVLIYCLQEGEAGGGEILARGGFEQLGPVFFKVTREKESLERLCDNIKTQGVKGPKLFAAAVQLDSPGKLDIEVQARDGTLLAKGVVTVRGETAEAWYAWRVVDAKIEPESVGLERWAMVPKWEGYQMMAWEGTKPKKEGGTANVEKGEGGEGALVKFVPTEPDGRLKLTQEKGELRLRSEVRIFEETEECFLTRWWVNGKPVRLPQEGARELHKLETRMREVQKLPMTVSWRMAEALGDMGAKAGDKVGVQVLYCRDGWTEAPRPHQLLRELDMVKKMRAIEDLSVAPVLLSNKVEWTVGAEAAAEGKK